MGCLDYFCCERAYQFTLAPETVSAFGAVKIKSTESAAKPLKSAAQLRTSKTVSSYRISAIEDFTNLAHSVSCCPTLKQEKDHERDWPIST